MNVVPALTALALGLGLALAAPVAASEHTGSGHHAAHDDAGHAAHADHASHAAAATIPADHVRWTPDAPLKAGMRRVHAAVHTLHHPGAAPLDDAAVREQAGEVDAAIAYMFANCTLEPEPDAALHGLLARLMTATRALKADPSDASAVAGLHDAVVDYPRLFEDPGFAGPSDH